MRCACFAGEIRQTLEVDLEFIPKNAVGFVLLSVLLFAAPLGAIDNARLLRSPDIFAGRIVFQYGGDLWTCSTSGGRAVQLTSHPGLESSPCFSPDGRWIAFSGQYDENMDVYIVPATGGEPKRLTFHPGPDQVTGWSADGRFVLFSSLRASSNRYARIFKVSVDGGIPEEMPMPMAWLGSMSADGKRFAYTSLSNRQSFETWRRYRGGNAPFIWVFDLQSHAAEKIPQAGGNDSFPRFSGRMGLLPVGPRPCHESLSLSMRAASRSSRLPATPALTSSRSASMTEPLSLSARATCTCSRRGRSGSWSSTFPASAS